MPAATPLKPADRQFFNHIFVVTYSNPFAPDRKRVLEGLVGKHIGKKDETFLADVFPELDARIARLDRQRFDSLEKFSTEDRDLMRALYLYQTYHRHIPAFDRLIENQLAGRDPPVPFAEPIIGQLTARGLSEAESVHYVGIYFQIRRAFYFIIRSLVGRSPVMQQVRQALWNNIFTNDMREFDRLLWGRMEDFSTLLLGETGTGKGSAASAIGRSGFIPFDRRKSRFTASFAQAFISTNLSQFPETLIESELFGHRKGAFTGAVDEHKGLFELCNRHGALFLDEIGELSVPVQIKLLQVLQERTFTSVGSHEPKRFAGRVIAATNKSIADLRTSGRFRDDLFYRLCSDVITLPTLRERLAQHRGELERLVRDQIVRLTGEEDTRAIDMILDTFKRDLPRNYPWPGNVRELEQAVRRVLLTHHYAGDLKTAHATPARAIATAFEAGTLSAKELLVRYCGMLYDRLGTIEEVARRSGLDRRTAKKYIDAMHAAR